MPFDIDDYVFIDDDNDRVLEEHGYRDDEPAIEYAENLARKNNCVIRVCKVIYVIDPKELKP